MLKLLSEMQINEIGRIQELTGGHTLAKKLDSMCIYIGREIQVIQRQSKRGPIIVKTGNAKIAIGYGIAQKIMISKE